MQSLNLNNIDSALTKLGLTQTDLAKVIGVTKESVSQWLQNKKFPHPHRLLKLATTLQLPFESLIIKEFDKYAPRIAFRKKAGAKTKDIHISKAINIGYHLNNIAPYLNLPELMVKPATLKNPKNEYRYIQDFSLKIRKDLNIQSNDVLEFTALIDTFSKMQAVIIPTLWGKKGKHENALHIYLPDSMTTWIFLNLDTHRHDFKFWMCHELGHVYSYDSFNEDESNNAEDFADNFAGALLFPETLAKKTYKSLNVLISKRNKINKIINTANKYLISPYTILKETNKYAKHNNIVEIDLGSSFPGAVTNFNKRHKTISELFFDKHPIKAKEYIETSEKTFKTIFFKALGKYIIDNNKSENFIQNILNVSILDAKEIYREILNASNQNPRRH